MEVESIEDRRIAVEIVDDRGIESLKIMPGLNPIVGETMEEAERKHEYLNSLMHPEVGLDLLSNEIGGVDLTGYPLDEPLPDGVLPDATNANKSGLQRVRELVDQKLTIREMFQRYGGARGQRTVKGTPAQIADTMEELLVERGVDGFLIQPSYLPGGLNDFVGSVIPELQRRGIFRTEYEGKTLRESLGLTRPRNQFAPAAE